MSATELVIVKAKLYKSPIFWIIVVLLIIGMALLIKRAMDLKKVEEKVKVYQTLPATDATRIHITTLAASEKKSEDIVMKEVAKAELKSEGKKIWFIK